MRENHEEWEELTLLMNVYMNEKGWNVTEALNFMKGVIVKSAKVWGVKKHMFDKNCDSMKKDFENFSSTKQT